MTEPHVSPAPAPAAPPSAGAPWGWGQRTFVMGILNVTPDSFSDGGSNESPARAAARAREMEEEGADWIDVGAESSRPGAIAIGEDEELRRLLPALEAVRAAVRLPISVDTAKASVARRALAAGATWVNDIWGLQGDPEMAEVVAEAGASVVVMHNQRGSEYAGDMIAAIARYLERSVEIAEQAGIPRERIVLDPGVGFGKKPAQSLEVLRALKAFRRLGFPLLLGASRKSVIGHVLDLPVSERLEGSLATTVAAVAAGFDAVRVHDVRPHVRAARMADVIYRSSHG